MQQISKAKAIKIFLFAFLLFAAGTTNAQIGIGIANPDASGQLDVSSTSKGFLPPRMDSIQRNAIVSPATGLIIYNTSINGLQVYNGTNWYSTVHFIGERYGGGIVFYVYDNGQHGLIAATSDLGSIEWLNELNERPRYIGTHYGLNTGAMNTVSIVAAQLQDNPAGNFAAKACADYSVTVNGVTYGDWYLPSLEELNLLFLKHDVVGGFADFYYWSSTDYTSPFAEAIHFGNGGLGDHLKFYGYYVRPIRSF